MRQNSTEERWLPVVGWEGLYEVSDRGRVRSVTRIDIRGRLWNGQLRKLGDAHGGYLNVGLSRNGKKTTKLVHSLVLEAFVGPRPRGLVACHGNGLPYDNELENLRWDTQSSNIRDAVEHGTHPTSSRTHCPSGHEYTAENTARYKNGRFCRECKRLWDRARYVPSPRGPNAKKTRCPQGHAYTEANTALLRPQAPGRSWRRKCKTCANEQRREKRAAARSSSGG